MQDTIWKRWIRKLDRIHLEDTEIKTRGDTIYINPTVKLIAGWGIFLIALLLFLLIGRPFSGGTEQTEPSPSASAGEEEEYIAFERNEYPEVNSFVENYLNAVTSADINVLSTMVTDPSQFSVEWLQKRKELASSYSNVDCYTKPGLTDGSYVVYAVVNTQIPGVEIQPLSLHQFYLIPNEYGGFLQDNTASANPEIGDYLNRIEQDPDVVELYERVNQNNQESAQQDEALRAFYEKIGSPVE